MKIDLIKWDNVKPGSKVDLNFVEWMKWKDKLTTYYIKNDSDLNAFTVYNPLTGDIESYNLTMQDVLEVNNIDDKKRETKYREPDVNDIVVFKEVIENPEYSLTPKKFFKIKDWDDKSKTCTLISIKNKFILRNIHWSDISSVSGIFNLDNIIDADELNSLKFNSISSTFGNKYHLYIRNDKYRKFLIIIVFDVDTREYGINLIDTSHRDESHDFKNYIESMISICFDQILNKFHSKPMPKRREVYSRINIKNDESLVEMKFKFKSWTCLYDLFFDNIFKNTDVYNIGMDKQKRIESVETDLKSFDAYCQKRIKGQDI